MTAVCRWICFAIVAHPLHLSGSLLELLWEAQRSLLAAADRRSGYFAESIASVVLSWHLHVHLPGPLALIIYISGYYEASLT